MKPRDFIHLPSHDASLDRGRKQARLRKARKLYRKYPRNIFPPTPVLTLPVPKGKNIVHLVDRQDDVHCFRLHKGRVYYVSEASMRLSISVARSNLISLGTCLGKFSKSGKFKLHITSLDYLAQYAKYKVSFMPTPFKRPCSNDDDEVWVKPNGEMPFLYGNHVLKAHLGRITEDTPEHQGVVVYSMNDVPLVIGFVFHTICHPQCSFRDSELRPRQQWTHGNWTRQPSSFFINRTYMQTLLPPLGSRVLLPGMSESISETR